jgi:hypothetical protein
MITVDQHHLYLLKADFEPADCPPKGYHYDPYTKAWRKNLTEAEVQNLWPYRTEQAVDKLTAYKTHETRYSDSSIYDETCIHCGGTDGPGDRSLDLPCPKNPKKDTKVEPIKDWLDDALKQVAPKPREDELHAAPDRSGPMPAMADMEMPVPVSYLTDSAVSRAPKEKIAELVEATALINTVTSEAAAKGDNVHLPQHYARYKIEPIRFSIENELDGFQFNIIKYVCRHPFKNKREDLRKALRYLEMYIKYTYDKDPDWWK